MRVPQVSVLGSVLCTMEPSAQQCELLHYFLHSPLVHSLSARQRICNIFKICTEDTYSCQCWALWAMSCYLSICCEKLSFCPVVTRDEGNPGGCSASFNHTPSREKQCLFRLNSTSANWSMRLRGAPPPMPCRQAGWSRQIRRRKLLVMMDGGDSPLKVKPKYSCPPPGGRLQ